MKEKILKRVNTRDKENMYKRWRQKECVWEGDIKNERERMRKKKRDSENV